MSDRDRTRQAVRDVGIGAGTVGLAVILTFWGSLAAVQAVVFSMTIAVLLWTATTRIERLRAESGWPRPLVFSALGALVAVNASVFTLTGFTALFLSTVVLVFALVVGVTRVLRRVGS